MTIKEMALRAYPIRHKQNKKGAEYDANLPRRKAFENGARAVMEEVEQALTPQKCLTDIGIDVCSEALVKTALQIIDELKE